MILPQPIKPIELNDMKSTQQNYYLSIETNIKKDTVIDSINNFVRAELEKIFFIYRDDTSIEKIDELIKILNDFNQTKITDAKRYEMLGISCSNQLKKIFESTKKSTSAHWEPLIGALYYIIAVCELSQNKYDKAIRNFFNSIFYSDHLIELNLASIALRTYSLLCGNITAENLIKADCECTIYRNKLDQVIKAKGAEKYQELASIYDKIHKEIELYSTENREKELIFSEIKKSYNLFKLWQSQVSTQPRDNKKNKETRDLLIKEKSFSYVSHNIDIKLLTRFYADVILDQLNALLPPKPKNKKINQAQYKRIAENIINVIKQHGSLFELINKIMTEIENNNKPNLYPHLKTILGQIAEQLKVDDSLFFSFHGNKDLNHLIHRLAIEQQLITFRKEIANDAYIKNTDEFIKETKTETEKIVVDIVCNIKNIAVKDKCYELVNLFFSESAPYKKILDDCTDLITYLFKDQKLEDIYNEHNDTIGLLHYLSLVSCITIRTSHIFYLCDSFYKDSILSDHLRAARAYARFKLEWYYGAKSDLEKIKNPSIVSRKLNKIKENLSNKYKELSQYLYSDTNAEAKELMAQLQDAIAQEKFNKILDLQKKYLSWNPYQITNSFAYEYHLLMSVCYLKMHAKSTCDDKTIYLSTLVDFLQNTFNNQTDLLTFLFSFSEKIAVNDQNLNRVYHQMLLEFLKNFVEGENKVPLRSLVFEKHVAERFLVSTQEVALDEEKEEEEEEVIKLEDIIIQTKKSMQPSLYAILKTDADTLKIVNDLYDIYDLTPEIINKYKTIENESLSLLKKYLIKSRDDTNSELFPFSEVIAALYYIIGTCQVAQNKFTEAQFNLDQAFIISDNIYTKAFAKILYVCSLSIGDITLNKVIKAKLYLKNNTSTFENDLKANQGLNEIFCKINSKVKLELNKQISPHDQSQKAQKANLIFSLWKRKTDEQDAKVIQEKLNPFLIYLDNDQLLLFYTCIIKNKINACLKNDDHALSLTQRLDTIRCIIEANKYIQFTSVIASVLSAISEEPSLAYFQLCELRIVLENIKKHLKIDNLLDCSLLLNEDINSIIELFTLEDKNEKNTEHLSSPHYYQSIDKLFSKDYFINSMNEFILSTINLHINNYLNNDLIKLKNDFLTINNMSDESIQKYKTIESDCFVLLNIELSRSRNYFPVSGSFYWHPVIAMIYYMIAISQLAQDKNVEAIFNFNNAINYLPTQLFSRVLKLGNVYASQLGQLNEASLIRSRACFDSEFVKSIKAIDSSDQDPLNLFSIKIFNAADLQITNGLNQNLEPEKLLQVSQARKSYESWLKTTDPLIAMKLKNELTPQFAHLTNDDILQLLANTIKYYIEDCCWVNKTGQQATTDNVTLAVNGTTDHVTLIVNCIVEANQYFPISHIITSVFSLLALNNPDKSDYSFKLSIFKAALFQVAEKTGIQFLFECPLQFKLNITNYLSHVEMGFRKFDKLPLKMDFITDCKKIANPILMELCNTISIKGRKDSVERKKYNDLIHEFNTTHNYLKLYNSCQKLINEIYDYCSYSLIIKNYSAPLTILSYLASMCLIAKAGKPDDFNKVSEQLLNDGLQLIKQLPLKQKVAMADLVYLARAFIRFNKKIVSHGMQDLEAISSQSVCDALRNQLNQSLTIFINTYPSADLKENKEIETLLDQFKACILAGKDEQAEQLRLQYEAYDENNIHRSHIAEFNFWLTILYIKYRTKLPAAINLLHDDKISIFLRKTLAFSEDFVKTLFRFQHQITEIYPDDTKLVSRFTDDYLQITNLESFAALYSSIFEKFICDFYKKPKVNEQKNTAEKNKPASTIIQTNVTKTDESKLEKTKSTSTSTPAAPKSKRAAAIQPKQNKAQNKAMAKLLKEIQGEEKNIINLQKQIAADEKKILNLQTNIATINLQLPVIQAASDKLDDDIQISNTEINSNTNQIQGLENEIKQLEDVIRLKKIKDLENKINTLNEITRVTQDKKQENDHTLSREKEYLNHINRLIQIDEAMTTTTNSLTESQRKIQELKDAVAVKEQEIARMKAAIANAKRLAEINEALAQDKKEIRGKRKKIKLDKQENLANKQNLNHDQAVNQKELADLKQETEQYLPHLYLKHFFYNKNDIDDLKFVYDLAAKLNRPLILKGSAVFNWFLLSSHDETSIDLSTKKSITDFDLSIDCIDTDSESLVTSLINNGFGNIVRGGSFVNLTKILNNGLKLDLSLKISPDAWHDPIPNTRGKAEIIFNDSAYSPIIKIIKNDPFYKSFKNACKYKEMQLDPPSTFTRNYAYRLYKAIKGYRGIIKITNIKDIKRQLFEYYQQTLSENRITIYLELSDFVKHKTLDDKDSDAIKMFKLIFNAFFKSKPNMTVNVSAFVDFFITCKDILFYEDKKVFKKQIDLMISLYSDNYDLAEIKDQVINVEFLHQQSIQQKKYAEQQAAMAQAFKNIQPPIIPQEMMESTYHYQHQLVQNTIAYNQQMLNASANYQQAIAQTTLNYQQQMLHSYSGYQPDYGYPGYPDYSEYSAAAAAPLPVTSLVDVRDVVEQQPIDQTGRGYNRWESRGGRRGGRSDHSSNRWSARNVHTHFQPANPAASGTRNDPSAPKYGNVGIEKKK